MPEKSSLQRCPPDRRQDWACPEFEPTADLCTRQTLENQNPETGRFGRRSGAYSANSKPVTLKLPNKRELTISREQLPLTPAYAFTDYRSQGQTINYIIMDLATPPTGVLTPLNGYVTLSRSRKSENVRLLRDFDEKLFTTPPDKHLELEDERLRCWTS